MPKKQTVIESPRGVFGTGIKDLWKFRELLFMLTGREVSLRYRQTFLGVLWVVLQPLLTTFIFTIIFGKLMKTPSEDVSYELFAFAGLLPWTVFSQALQRGGISMTRDLRLITKIYIPRILLPVSSVLSTLIDFAVSLVIFAIMLVIYRTPVGWSLLAIPFLLILTLVLSVGVGMIFASLNVFYRDFTYILPFVVQIWMYASPLAYSASIIPAGWGWVYDLNPLVGIINGFRWAIFHTSAFPGPALLYSIGFSAVVFTISLALFHRLERSFADVI